MADAMFPEATIQAAFQRWHDSVFIQNQRTDRTSGPRARGQHHEYEGFDAEIFVDEIAGERGVADRLRELGYPLVAFNASRRASTEERQQQFTNLRAEASARLRDRLIAARPRSPTRPS